MPDPGVHLSARQFGMTLHLEFEQAPRLQNPENFTAVRSHDAIRGDVLKHDERKREIVILRKATATRNAKQVFEEVDKEVWP